jgi:hypothetical protein
VEPLYGFLDAPLVLRIQGAGRLIQDQQGRLAQQRPGQSEPLALSPGEANTSVAKDRLQTLG